MLPAFTAQELQKADDAEHSYRSVRRLLCAGTPFTVVSGSVKEQNVKDFAVLLGDLWDEDAFPLRGGRLFIAGKQQTFLFLVKTPPDRSFMGGKW